MGNGADDAEARADQEHDEGLDLSQSPEYKAITKSLDEPVTTPPRPMEGDDQPQPAQPVHSQVVVHQEEAAPEQRTMTIVDTGETSVLNPAIYMQMKALASDFVKSGALSACWTTPAAVLVGLQTGVEMGMKPMEAMNSLYFVKGAINVWGKAVVRRLKEHGWSVRYDNESQESCTATIQRGREKYVETYTFSEAEQSGYTKDNYGQLKVGWKPGINRKLKLRYGVLALIIKTYVPEVLGPAVGIVEVDEDGRGEPKQISAAEEKVGKALAARAEGVKETKATAVPTPA